MIGEVPPCYLLGDFDTLATTVYENSLAVRDKQPPSNKEESAESNCLKKNKYGGRTESNENTSSAGSESHGRSEVIDLTGDPKDRDFVETHTPNESRGRVAIKGLTDAPENRDSIHVQAQNEIRHGHSAVEDFIYVPEDRDSFDIHAQNKNRGYPAMEGVMDDNRVFVDKNVQNDFGLGGVHPPENSLESFCGSLSDRRRPVRASRAKCASDITNFSIQVANQESVLRDLALEMESSVQHIENLEGYLSASKSGLRRISPRITDLMAREKGLRILLQKHFTEADKIGSLLAASSLSSSDK